ncbi:MAG: phosphoribulokinase, partial [Ruminococcaceae bacterium]|nr:phosphoribulokinase [Oscillospiraceae bacterium]
LRSPQLLERFVTEWIPLEDNYFRELGIREKCDVVIEAG